MLENQLIVSMPNLDDQFFDKIVVYICEHNDQGAVGLIVNQPTEYNLSFIFEQLNIEHSTDLESEIPVLFGGPVQQDRGFIIHKPLEGFQPSIDLNHQVCVSTSQEILRRIASGNGPEDITVTLGYSGWAADQLIEEIKQNIWLTCDATDEILYNTPFEERWQKAIDNIGIDLMKFSTTTGHG